MDEGLFFIVVSYYGSIIDLGSQTDAGGLYYLAKLW